MITSWLKQLEQDT